MATLSSRACAFLSFRTPGPRVRRSPNRRTSSLSCRPRLADRYARVCASRSAVAPVRWIVLTPAGGCISVEALGEEADFPVRDFEFDPDWLTRKVCPEIDFDFGAATAQPVFNDPIIAVTLDRIYHEAVSPSRTPTD